MVVRRESFPVGNAGSKYSIREVARLAREQYASPEHHAVTKAWVAHCLKAAGSPRTIPERLDAILRAIWAETVYFPDPVYIESIQAPHITLSGLVPGGDCFAQGTTFLGEGGEVVVEDVLVGSKIWGLTRFSVIEAKTFKGVLGIDHVRMEGGKVLRLTGDHHVYVLDCSRHPMLDDGEEPRVREGEPEARGCSCSLERRTEKRSRVTEIREGMRLPAPWTCVEDHALPLRMRRVESIERRAEEVPCWDIQTDDHRVFLAESGVTVSNCDDLAAAFLGAIGCAGIHGVSVGHAFPERDADGNDMSRVIAHVLAAAWEPLPTQQNPGAGRWWYADASVKNQPLGTYARKPSWEYVIDVPTGETLCEKDVCLMPGSSTAPSMLTGPGAYLGVSGVPPEVLFESPIEEDHVVLEFAPASAADDGGSGGGSMLHRSAEATSLGVAAGAPVDPAVASQAPATIAFLAATDPAWVKYFQYEADSLIVSWNRGLGSYAALRKMAADLSLPFPDPPASEQAMLRTGWTADDDQVVVQLSGLVDVTARAFLDVASGKRKIFPIDAATGLPDPNGTDIGVELLPSDAAKVGYPPGAGPAPQGSPAYMPSLLDAKAPPSPSSGVGTGSPWLLSGSLTAGTVTTVEMAANIRAICETMVSISSHARATTLARAEALIAASGTATPAQSTAMTKAVTDSIVKETSGDLSTPAAAAVVTPLWQKGLLLGGLALLLFLGVKAVMKHLEEKKTGKRSEKKSSGALPKLKQRSSRAPRQLTA